MNLAILLELMVLQFMCLMRFIYGEWDKHRFVLTFVYAVTFGIVFGTLTSDVSAQSISDCDGAIVLCGDLYTEMDATLNTGDVYEFTGLCNANLEQSSVWYTFTVQSDGLLSFVLDPLDPMDDYDWGLFDITTGGCEGIGVQFFSPEVGCNSFGEAVPIPNGATGISTANGGVGNSNGPGNLNGPPFNADLPVTLGEQYALVVMNWTNSLEGYTIDFGQSTASLYDQTPPSIDSVGVDCTLSVFTVQLAEFVLVSSAEAADFQLIGPDLSVHSFAGLTPLDATADLASQFELTLVDPVLQSGLHQLVFTESAGSVEDPCGNLGEGFAAVDLTILDPPVPWDLVSIPICEDDHAAFSVNSVVTQPVTTSYEYIWTMDAIGNMEPEVVGNGAGLESNGDGIYTVYISTIPECYEASGSFSVYTEECSLIIPNVITPGNGDAINDGFLVEGLERYPGSEVRIFNRWGHVVFESRSFEATAGWDPSLEEAVEGTYWYELRIPRGQDEVVVLGIDGEQRYPADANPILILTGSFALLR